MKRRLRDTPGSCILTSGVLIADYDSLLDAAAALQLRAVDEERENEWVASRFEVGG
jgi:hypothetical protein